MSKKPIAYAIYLSEGDSLYTKALYSEKEIKTVTDGEDEDVEEWKCKLVRGENLTVEDHT